MSRIPMSVVVAGSLLLISAGSALGDDPHTTSNPTGQPSQSCQSFTPPPTPGNAAMAQGSPFNPTGTAGGVYAGQQLQNSKNPNSVAQYDVACFQQFQHAP